VEQQVMITTSNIETTILSLETKLKVTIKLLPEQAPKVEVTTDKHTYVTTIGKLMAKHGSFNATQIKETSEEYKLCGADTTKFQVTYSTDFVTVYRTALYAAGSTTKSCMTDMDCVRVYGYDENIKLFLVYLPDATLVGRTLVRTDEMKYVRIYIDHNRIKDYEMYALLAKHGYTEGNLTGLDLEKIETEKGIVCPYLDGGLMVDVNSDHLYIAHSGEFDTNTSGYLKDNHQECDCCGDRFHEEDMYYVEGHGSICSNCLDSEFIYYGDEYYPVGDCIVNESNGEYVPEHIANNKLCLTEDGDYYDWDDVVETADGWYHADRCKPLVITDEYYGTEYILKEDAVYVCGEEGFKDGYYTQEQVDEIKAELEQEDENV
jgi:hypothetical protein